MDHIEKISARESIQQAVTTGEFVLDQRPSPPCSTTTKPARPAIRPRKGRWAGSGKTSIALHRIARRLVPAWLIEETFRKHRNLDTIARVNLVAREIEQKIGIQYNYDLMPDERKELKAAIKGTVKQSTLRETYKRFFEWVEHPEMFKTAKGGKLEYADVFPLIYLKMRLEGIRSPWRNVKHLLIDEMQDYTPVQYAVIARFAQRISPNPDLEIIERHGDEPEVLAFKSRKKKSMLSRSEFVNLVTTLRVFT